MTGRERGDDEYAALEVGAGWPVASLACFAASIGARFLVKLLPLTLRPWPWRVLLPALAATAFALLGLLLGLAGLRQPRSRGLARLAVFLNGVTLALSALLFGAFVYILPE